MKKFLSHLSAAVYWNIPYIKAVLGSEITEAKTVDFIAKASKHRGQLKALTEHWLPNGMSY